MRTPALDHGDGVIRRLKLAEGPRIAPRSNSPTMSLTASAGWSSSMNSKGGTPVRLDGGALQAMAEAAEHQVAEWRVPGMALAVVDDGGPRLVRGFGLASVADRRDVTADTVFAIGSCTKAFTTTAVAMLVDDGLLDWDAPARQTMPDFELMDPVASREITLRDMCCHRSGLPRHDLVWYNASLSQVELVRRMRYLEPSRPFRAGFQYSNLMYMAAGQVVERAAGRPWSRVVAERILGPLAMASSLPAAAGLEGVRDGALPYTRKGEGWRLCDRYVSTEGRPSGSVQSTATDMARWLMFQLDGGSPARGQLVSREQMAMLRTPQVVPEPALQTPGTTLSAYALGWSVSSYHGHLLIAHAGGVRGYAAMVSFMPEERLGVAILTNMDGHALGASLQNTIYDLALGRERVDWVARLRRPSRAGFVLVEEAAPPRVEGTSPSHPPDAYAGTYRHPAYGDLDVQAKGESLAMRFHAMPLQTAHHHYDQFHVTGDVVDTIARFETGLDGRIVAVGLRLEPNARVSPIVFRRIGGAVA